MFSFLFSKKYILSLHSITYSEKARPPPCGGGGWGW